MPAEQRKVSAATARLCVRSTGMTSYALVGYVLVSLTRLTLRLRNRTTITIQTILAEQHKPFAVKPRPCAMCIAPNSSARAVYAPESITLRISGGPDRTHPKLQVSEGIT